MGGGLLQLVAYGAQDVYLTGNPQITFFKVVYRRHTNFSMEAIQQTFNGTVDFGKRVTAQISRNGDLIHKMYIEATINSTDFAVDIVGICSLPPVYSNKYKSLVILNSSARFGIPFRPSLVLETCSFITPLDAMQSS